MKKSIFKFITVVVVISLCTASVFASNAPTPIYSNDSLEFSKRSSLPAEISYLYIDDFSVDQAINYYFLIDGALYTYPALFADGIYYFGDLDCLVNGTEVSSFCLMYAPGAESALLLPYSNCPSEEHYHSLAIYDEDPFYEAPPSGDSSQDFMNSLNDGTLEDAGDILDSSLDELPDLSQFSNFSSFLSAALAWVPAGWWFVYRLCFVMLMARVVMVFLWR